MVKKHPKLKYGLVVGEMGEGDELTHPAVKN
jgi:hypothetical protein